VVEDGRLIFGAFSYGGTEGPSGTGDLAIADLILLDEAETVLNLLDVQLVTSGGEDIAPRDVGAGTVRPQQERIYLPLVVREFW
jgi:hypothetical protein